MALENHLGFAVWMAEIQYGLEGSSTTAGRELWGPRLPRLWSRTGRVERGPRCSLPDELRRHHPGLVTAAAAALFLRRSGRAVCWPAGSGQGRALAPGVEWCALPAGVDAPRAPARCDRGDPLFHNAVLGGIVIRRGGRSSTNPSTRTRPAPDGPRRGGGDLRGTPWRPRRQARGALGFPGALLAGLAPWPPRRRRRLRRRAWRSPEAPRRTGDRESASPIIRRNPYLRDLALIVLLAAVVARSPTTR